MKLPFATCVSSFLLLSIYYSNGPHGTAICAYSAENSAEHGGNGLSQSMFDIFRADLVTPDGMEAENTLVEVGDA